MRLLRFTNLSEVTPGTLECCGNGYDICRTDLSGRAVNLMNMRSVGLNTIIEVRCNNKVVYDVL